MQEYRFKKAKPVWAAGRECEMNCELAFRTELFVEGAAKESMDQDKILLRVAASSLYRVWINGGFVSAGPARAAHGYYCVDTLPLNEWLGEGRNAIVIEVLCYNVNTYDTLDQPGFLTMEITRGENVLSYTGDASGGLYDLRQRVRRVQRYSFQRAFAECYHLDAAKQFFYLPGAGGAMEEKGEKARTAWEKAGIREQEIGIQAVKKYLVRAVDMPQFERLPVRELIETGRADYQYRCPSPKRDRSYLNIGERLKGFSPEELEEALSEEGQNIKWMPRPFRGGTEPFPLSLSDEYGIYAFPYNASGFLRIQVECEKECVLYVFFDEILVEGELDFLRLETCNCFKYVLGPGSHRVMTFAPYTMKYVKAAVKGTCVLRKIDMVEYKHPPVEKKLLFPENGIPGQASLQNIYHAALETFLSNSVDIFTDCPSRERAGWLCDSFFTARTEYALTGGSRMEKAFLENYIYAEPLPQLPSGMLPMCYPSDHYDGNFIPNWGLWFILQLGEYADRSVDRALIAAARDKVYGLLRYFEGFENEYGLLEKLEGWIFVEWSRANDPDVVQDVNFPTNMLYAKALETVSRLYQDPERKRKADGLKRVIRERSLTEGVFYTDNEVRTPRGLHNPGNHTEICQYYAFFTGVADKDKDAGLWEILVKDFGPQRRRSGKHSQVAQVNMLNGVYLRLELLYRDKRYEEVLDEIVVYFERMAQRTGTLWEHDSTIASCNHGFASHVIYWMMKIINGGVR